MEPVLTFDSVTWATASASAEPLGPVDVVLPPGGMQGICYSAETDCPPIADLAAGLREPQAGQVTFAGQPWSAYAPFAAAAARGRIGRIFAGQAWVSNLDVDENITLAQRHHGHAKPADVRKSAEALARRLGLNGLPGTRPAWTPRRELQLAQWVRALLAPPSLLLVEQPWPDFSDGPGAALRTEIETARKAGMAVVWLVNDERLMNNEYLKTSQWGCWQDGKWTRIK